MLFNPQLKKLTLGALQVLIRSYVASLTEEEGYTIKEAVEMAKDYVLKKEVKLGIRVADSMYSS